MKKTVLVIVLSAVAFSVSAQSVQDELLGKWRVEPFITEREDGLLVEPEARYAYPYTGISGINFIDTEFVVFTVDGREFRAFYEMEILDFDNYNINCTFKGGEALLLKLVRSGTVWKILYRVSSESVLKVPDVQDVQDFPARSPVDEMALDSADPMNPEVAMDEQDKEPVPESLYAGVIIKKEDDQNK